MWNIYLEVSTMSMHHTELSDEVYPEVDGPTRDASVEDGPESVHLSEEAFPGCQDSPMSRRPKVAQHRFGHSGPGEG